MAQLRDYVYSPFAEPDVEPLLGLLQDRHSLRVEWYIVILIVVEILLTRYALFMRHV
jgi:uncharacterized Rmd1/YagE family protein